MNGRVLLLGLAIAIVACGPSARRGDDDDNVGDGGNCTASQMCSADLHDVVDCAGNVVMACAPNQGCASGACVDACQAAATNSSSIGCDYYAIDPDMIEPGGCFAAYIANTWSSPITINVEYNGASLAIDSVARIPSGQGQSLTYAPLTGGMLPPGQVAILFLAQNGGFVPCPVTPAVTLTDAQTHGTALGKAFHITTSSPVVAYDIAPYGGGSSAITSATLLLPTSAWDTNYVAVDAFKQSQIAGQPNVVVVAQTDNTHVTIRPTVAIVGGTGVAAAAASSNATYVLSAGQSLQLEQPAELGGSPITSDQPIGVWGGASCLNIPITIAACDAAHQQIPPVKAMGNHYVAVRYRNRFVGQEETVPWRFVGGVDGTTLTYSPAAPPGAPTTLSLGQVVELDAPGPFSVQSQDAAHPFYMSAHMTGCQQADPSEDDCRGDPEFVNIVPPEQYLSSYTFFTDPTYPETNLVFTRQKTGNAFADVSLDCAGTLTGWMPVDSADTIEYTRLDLVTGSFQSQNGCNNGLHVATSAEPFGLVVWGWGNAITGTTAVSYAYPAGAGIKQINTVVIE